MKIGKYGIRLNGKYFKARYFKETNSNITIYAKGYGENSLPIELMPKNNSEPMIDYFETSKAVIKKEHPFYNEFLKFAR